MAVQSAENQPTMDQKRAAHALEKVKDILKEYPNDEKKQDSYADYVERLPAAILTNGLGQALAQLLAAAKRTKNPYEDPHYWLYQNISDWLLRSGPEAYKKEKDILDAITRHGRNKYMQALAEAMAWLEWHKKLAVAYLKQPEGKK